MPDKKLSKMLNHHCTPRWQVLNGLLTNRGQWWSDFVFLSLDLFTSKLFHQG